jgi:hypothetical protein
MPVISFEGLPAFGGTQAVASFLAADRNNRRAWYFHHKSGFESTVVVID